MSRQVAQTEYANEWQALEEKYSQTFEKKREEINAFLQASEAGDETELTAMKEEVNRLNEEQMQIQGEVKELVGRAIPLAETKDTDYVFISFIMQHFPTGLIGLLLAVIFSAAMSSTASELNALGSTSVVDLYKRSFKQEASDQHYLNASRFFTLLWGVIAIVFATFASLADNLIEFVNIIGSIFYGTILGIFLVAFYIKYVKSNAIFIAACIAEATVLYLFFTTDIGFLWFNVIGCALVVAIALLIEMFMGKNKVKS